MVRTLTGVEEDVRSLVSGNVWSIPDESVIVYVSIISLS